MEESTYIADLIAQGEHQQLDFKYAINDSKKIARSLSAFANTDGGILLLGVKDNGRIAGVNSDEEYYMIEAAALLYSKPPVPFTVKQWVVQGKAVLEVMVKKSSKRPHLAPNKDGALTAYVRIADENIVANQIQVRAWKKMRSKKSRAFTYTDKYNLVINALEKHERLTLPQLCAQVFMSQTEAESLLVELVAEEIVQIHYTDSLAQFGLAT